MRCNQCNARLGSHDLWCVNCGRQTPNVKQELSAIKSIRETWLNYEAYKTKNIPAAAISVLFGVLPLVLLIWLFNTVLAMEADSSMGLIKNMLIKALGYSVFVPIIIVAFAGIARNEGYSLSVDIIKSAIKRYHIYFGVAAVSSLYYILIYLICFGLPNFGSDPILRLVWIVLANYWLAIIIPVPALAELKEISVLKALSLSYRHFHDVRWNLYLFALILLMINALALAFFVIGLVVTIPFSVFAIRDYTQKLIDFELLDYRR